MNLNYDYEELINLKGTCIPSPHGSQYAQSFSSFMSYTGTQAIEQGLGIHNFSLPPNYLLNSDDASIVPSNSLPQTLAKLPITLLQNSLSGMLPHSNSSMTLPAEAPVPHDARTEAALRLFGDKQNHIPTAGNTGAGTQVDLDDYFLHPNIQTATDYNTLANDNSKQTATGQSKLVIPPISPSTLMALTEPCLMAWCSAFDECLAEPGPSPYFPSQNSGYNNYVETKSNAVYNIWGY